MAEPDALPGSARTRRRAGVWFGFAGVLAALLILAYVVLAQGRDAAAFSCLASIHAYMQRTRIAQGTTESTEWRLWGEAEIARMLSGLPSDMDCASDPAASWRARVRIRSRLTQSGELEAQLWLPGRPGVTSPSGAQVPE